MVRRMARLPEDLTAQIAANKRRATALVAGAVALVVVVLTLLGAVAGSALVGLVVGVVAGAVVGGAAWTRSTSVALSLAGAAPADEEQHARLHNLVEGLCAAAGLPKPALYVVADAAPDAFAVGRGPRNAAVVCTAGLLDGLTRMELEGVLAHELSHVKNYDILPATLAVTLLGLPGTVVPPLRTGAMRRVVGEHREALGDVSGVSITRYPPGLISALEKLRREDGGTGQSHGSRAHGSKAIDHLWLDSPAEDVNERIAALREL